MDIMPTLDDLFRLVPDDNPRLITAYIMALLVSFILGQFTAWAYMGSHRGVSYSRTFSQSLVLIGVISAMSMSIVSLNVFAAFGLMGGMALIRFRTVVRDARDTVYVLLALVSGMAVGFGFVREAIVGCVSINFIALYLHRTGFGALHTKDGLLRFQIDSGDLNSDEFRVTLKSFCRRWTVLSVDSAPRPSKDHQPLYQCAYNVRLRDLGSAPLLVAALQDRFNVSNVHLLATRENEEVS